MEPPVVAATIAAVTALVAVTVGPFFTFRASKNSMLGPMRQAWINSLRDTVAEYIASIYISPEQFTGAVSNNDDIRHAVEVGKRNQLETTYRLKEKICLLINPTEPDHQELVRLVECAYGAQVQGRDTTIALLAIRKHAQVILKTEWNVVKK